VGDGLTSLGKFIFRIPSGCNQYMLSQMKIQILDADLAVVPEDLPKFLSSHET
jgi:hypothetical protein